MPTLFVLLNNYQLHYSIPIKGILTLPSTISKEVFLTQGTPVCSIVPISKDTTINKKLVRAMTPISEVGKIQKGSKTIIRFDAYPYKEYGTIDTKVEDISLLPIKDKEGKVYYDLIITMKAMGADIEYFRQRKSFCYPKEGSFYWLYR